MNTTAAAYPSQGVVWRLLPGLCLHSREVGALVAVFNEESGDTHLIEPWAADLLDRLQQRPADQSELAEACGGREPEAVFRVLREFHFLGLIEPVNP